MGSAKCVVNGHKVIGNRIIIIIIIIIIIFSLGLVKKQLQKRAVKTMMGLGQHFRKMDQSGDGVLDRQELLRALHTYHIQIPEEVYKTV